MEDLTPFEMKLLIQWFQHHMTATDRIKLMQVLPQAYNKMSGREIVQVRFSLDMGVKSGEPVR